MWAGGLGVLATCPEYIHADGFYVRDLAQSSESFREIGCDPHRVFVAERIAKVAVQSLMIAASLWLLSTIMPLRAVVFAGLLMSFSPWQAGLDQLLHVDGMFASASVLTFSAAAAMTVWSIRHPDRSWKRDVAGWLGVGFGLALAVLTRSAAIVYLIPIGLGILAATAIAPRSANQPVIRFQTILQVSRSGLAVGTGCFVTVIALFPALWVTPRDVANRLLGFTDTAITEGHELALYYNGQIVAGDPGPMFYLDALLWRSTPAEWLVLAGVLVLAVIGLVFAISGRSVGNRQPSSIFWIVLAMAAIFVLVYATGITLAAKKFERYFIVASPFIAIAGGLVWGELSRRISRPVIQKVASATLAVLVVMQAVSLSNSRPYMLDYFSPLVGGHEASVTKFQIGWGQGGDQVTNWLVDQSDGEPLRVRSSTVIGVFSVFVPMGSHVRFERGLPNSVSDWYHTDFYVSGIQQTQRNLDRSIHLFEGQEPAHTVKIDGITYFETYEVNSQPVPDALWETNDCRHITAIGLQLMTVEQQGNGVLVILRIDDLQAASGSWVSIDDAHENRLLVRPTGEGILVGVVFADSTTQDIQNIAIGGASEALSYEFPFGSCSPQ